MDLKGPPLNEDRFAKEKKMMKARQELEYEGEPDKSPIRKWIRKRKPTDETD